MLRARTWLGGSAVLAAVMGTAGCGLVLGLGDFKDAEGSGGAGTTSTTTSSSTDDTTATSTTSTTSTTTSSSTGGGGGGGMLCSPGATQGCYSGDPATQHVGACKDGQQTCDDQGTAWGACEGEQLPAAAEDCGNDADDDCNGTVNDGCACSPGTSSPCYDGPAGTEGKGICQGGSHTCNGDGMGFGVCMGEVLPAPAEDCYKPGDEDCDGVPCSDVLWAKQYGDSGIELAQGVGVNGNTGDIYLAGQFGSTIDFGCGLMVASGTTAFIAKFDQAGTCKWSKQFGSTEQISSLAVDADGNVAVAGITFSGTANLGGADLGAGVFLGEFDASGLHKWSKTCGGAVGSRLYGLTFDSQKNVVAGGAGSGLDCGAGAITNGAMLAKFSGANGAPSFTKGFGGGTVRAVATDPVDNIFITGEFAGSLNLGTGSMTQGGTTNGFLAKFTSSGSAIWSRGYGDSGTTRPVAIAIDSAAGPIIAGELAGTMSTGNVNLSSTGASSDVFVLSANAAGAANWGKRYGDDSTQKATSIASDAGKNIYVIGVFGGTIDFGAGPITAAGTTDFFVAKLSQIGGTEIWGKGYPAGTSKDLLAARNSDSGLILAGDFFGPVDFGTVPPLTPAGGYDAFLARIAP